MMIYQLGTHILGNKNNHELTSKGVKFTMNQTSAVVIMGEYFQTEITKEIVRMVCLEISVKHFPWK